MDSTISIFHDILADYSTPTQLTCMEPYDLALSSDTFGYLATPITPKSNQSSLKGDRYASTLMECGCVLARNASGVNASADSQRPALLTFDIHGRYHVS